MHDHNRSIHCNVESCVFNKNACECTADKIDVSCTCANPDCCDETECKTFKSRD